MKYGFWKLLRNQWSWENDKSLFIIQPIISAVWTLMLVALGSVKVEPSEYYWHGVGVLFVGSVAVGLMFYHTLKLVVFSLYCAFVSYQANKGNPKAIGMYGEMLIWRQ